MHSQSDGTFLNILAVEQAPRNKTIFSCGWFCIWGVGTCYVIGCCTHYLWGMATGGSVGDQDESFD